MTDYELDALFDAQRDAVPPPSEAFLARIAADAAQAAHGNAQPRAVVPTAPQSALSGGWGWLLATLAPGGLIAAALTGLWIGLAGPQTLPDPALLWSGGQDDLSAQAEELWYGLRDLDTMEWDDG